MARVHRPPPPVPTVEHEEIDDNYGVWAEDEFDEFDPGEIYENTEDPPGEDDSDYEHPDEPDPAPAPARPGVRPLPVPAAPVIPPIPPRPGFRPLPNQASLRPEPRVGGISPRASPLPQPSVEDEETYEIIDTPQSPPIDDGEVYEEVDEKPMLLRPSNAPLLHSSRPVPKPGGAGLKAHPQIPVPDFKMKDVPTKPKQAEIKRAISPNLPRRDLPLPPPVKPTPSGGRVPPFQRPSPQPSPPPPPPPEPEMDDMYTGAEFYADAERDSPPPPQPFPGGLAKNTKPLPRPPSEGDGEGDVDDEYYTEVPETKPNAWKATAGRPIPPLPQPQPVSGTATALASSGRFPVEKLQAGLARMAEASRKTREPEQAVDVLSGSAFLNAKSQLKPVNRVESLKTPETPRMPTVKRAESDNTARLAPFDKKGDRKISKISEVTSRFESEEQLPEKPGINLSPMFPRKDSNGNRNMPPVANVKPTRAVPVPKPDTNETFAPQVPRVSPFRNFKDEANAKETKPAAESKSTPNEKRALPKPPPSDELGGLYSYGWYFSTIERSSAETKILDMKQDGSFLVRKSKRGGESNPYTLTLLYRNFIYNLHIRRRPDQKYALGSEKPDEHVFNSVGDLISFHRNNPIEVVGDARKNATPGKVVLKASPNK